MTVLDTYLQRIQEISEEYGIQIQAEPGEFLILVRQDDPTRVLSYLNSETPELNPNLADVIEDELTAFIHEGLDIDG